jgi:hypothetical protein
VVARPSDGARDPLTVLGRSRRLILPLGLAEKGDSTDSAEPHRGHQVAISKLNSSGLFAGRWLRAPPTVEGEGLADTGAANPFALPRRHPGIRFAGPSLDHLVRPLQERLRNRQAERLRGLEVDDQLELRRLLDGQVGRLGALEDLVDVSGRAAEQVG